MNGIIIEARHWISYVLEWSLMVLVLWLPIRYLFRTGRFLGAVLRMWLGIICWGVLLCAILPLTIVATTHDRHAFDFFPEMPGAIAVVFAGWLPALLFCGVAYLCRALWLRRGREHSERPSASTSPS